MEQLLALARTTIQHKVIRNWRRMRREQQTQADKIARDEADRVGRSASEEPNRAVDTEDLKDHILASLSASDRRLIELRIQGFSAVEIAEMLGCDAHALRAHLSRLRQKLRQDGFSEWL